ncbi:MAG TPA: MFS transporter [Solirubrobacterales bacterium]|jgi:EmrB/QacA subfamily drug resistance transporter
MESVVKSHDRRWLVLAILGIAQLMVVLDATVVNIALPSAQEALGFSESARQWIVTAYSLTFGSLLLLGGRISDIFGRKWTFVGGLIGFAIASAVGGAAPSFAVLVAARAVQGLFGAILAPAALSLLTVTFTDPQERGKAFGVFGALAGSGAAVGLLLGGILTQYLSWRWCLWVNLAFAAVAVVGALMLLDNHRSEEEAHLDVPGTVLATGGLFCLVYGLSHAETASWTSPLTLAMFAIALVAFVAFAVVERRASHPLLPLSVVLDRNRGGSYLVVALGAIAIFAVFLFLTFYLQRNLGYSPVTSGLAFLPMVACIMFTSVTSNVKLMPLVGPKPLVTAGCVLGAIGMFYLTGLGANETYLGSILPALLIAGLGFGLIFAPSIATATYGVPQDEAGIASAMVNTSQQVGGSIGVALLSTVSASATSSALSGLTAAPTSAQLMAAETHGYTTAFYWAGSIFVLAALVAFGLLRAKARPTAPGMQPVTEPERETEPAEA